MKVLVFLIAAVLLPNVVHAQCSRIIQNGTVSTGNAPVWVAPCGLQAAGGSAGSYPGSGGSPMITDLGIQGDLGILNGPITGAYNWALLDWSTTTPGEFDFNLSGLGGATPATAAFIINGIKYPLFGSPLAMEINAANATSAAQGNLLSAAGTSAQTTTGYWTFNNGANISRGGAPTGTYSVVDTFLYADNTSTSTPGYGNRYNWYSSYLGNGVPSFEIGWGNVSDLNANVGPMNGKPTFQAQWEPIICPNDARSGDTYACVGREVDVGFQGLDAGWQPSRNNMQPQWAVGSQIVPTCNGSLASGTCKNIGATYVVAENTQEKTASYNGFLCDYDPVTGLSSIAASGYCLYGTGDETTTTASFTGAIASGVLTTSAVTGTVAKGQQIFNGGTPLGIIVSGSGSTWQLNNTSTVGSESMTANLYPYAPLGFGGTFLHGVQLGGATYNDGIALEAGANAIDAGSYTLNSVLVASKTAVTVASGGCTSPAVTYANGTVAWELTMGSSCSGSQPVVLTLPTATHGWTCRADDITHPAQIHQTAVGATSATLTNYPLAGGAAQAWTAADVVTGGCVAF